MIGFHASHELYSPRELLRLVKKAAAVGFQAAMASDHFHPWTIEQGESGYVWSWLGAGLEATSLSFGTVCAPGQRYHPAIIAQAAATLSEMYPDRFWLAVGTGQALNESITGDDWPKKAYRRARLLECVAIMRALWAGEEVTHQGRIRIHRAKLYTRASKPPLLVGAAITANTAEWVGGWADALITVGRDHEAIAENIQAFREGGGDDKPVFLQAALSWAPTEAEAQANAFQRWPVSGLDVEQLEDLPTPQDFQRRLSGVSSDDVARKIRVSSDLKRHIAWLRGDLELGINRIYLHHVGGKMDRFLDVFAEKVLPQLMVKPQP